MKPLLIALAFASSGVASATAADLPTTKGPPPAPTPIAAPTWTGFSLGVDGGYAWGDADWRFPVVQFYASAAGQGFSGHPSGGLLGGHIGYDYQWGSWVIGAQAEADWTDLRKVQIGPVSPIYPNDKYTTKFTDFESGTARVGYAFGAWLVYGRAGVATTNLDFNVLSGVPVPGVTADKSFRLWGPTIGAGVETLLAGHYAVGLEYDYAHFNRGGFATAASNGAPVTLNGASVEEQTLLARLSYKF